MKSILVILFTLLSIVSYSQSYLKEFEEKISNSRAYTLEVLDLFPEDQMDFQPTKEVRTARKQFEQFN
ncbi:MAG: hypothetical protein HRT71_06430 [Flavobacteriales bacterium]|nr:hypothetical protein [Flavobacteriales bacterium]